MSIKEKVTNWFVKKYDVDEERLQLIEHKGEDVIHFIEQYVKDNDIGKQLGDMLSSLLVSKSRLRAEYSIRKENLILQNGKLKDLIEHQIINELFKAFQKEKGFTIKREDDLNRDQVIFKTDVFIFDTDILKDTIESYIRLMPEWKLKELKGWE